MWAWLHQRRAKRLRVRMEDALKHLHSRQWGGRGGQTGSIDSLKGALGLSSRAALRLCEQIQAAGFVRVTGDGLRLTPDGERLALQVIRAHRLWETYLADDARLPFGRLHDEADRREHNRPDESLRALEIAAGFPETDPHGDPIPTEQGHVQQREGVPLTEWPPSETARITHIEDEPREAFAQIVTTGLRPGSRLTVIASGDDRIELTDGTDTIVLAPVVAANIHVTRARQTPTASSTDGIRLNQLPVGMSAVVESLAGELRGLSRRRLLDLGLTPGAAISTEYQAISGDPVCYRIRGALIALRHDQSQHVVVRPTEQTRVSSGAA